MRTARICLALTLCLFALFTNGQRPYFQQQADYRIDARLDDSLHQIDATASIQYRNQSPDTLHYIWFHLWPNAYKTERTALGEQLLENGDTRFYFSSPDQKGYINRLDFRVNGMTARTEDHPEHIDIIKLILPEPLLPGKSVEIFTPFHVQLPEVFSRSGHGKNGTYQITQWYPKPAVYDRAGWHAMPYLDQGEFYSEFGNYDLYLTVPADYVVASTGTLQDSLEIKWLKQKNQSLSKEPHQKKTGVQKTLHYRADSVHDVGWFASRRFLVAADTCRLPDGKILDVWHFYPPERAKPWKQGLSYSKQGLRYYSSRIGAYPYQTISVVETAEGPGGGMEYPMLATIDPTTDTTDLKSVIIHEIGHTWFYGALGSNERDHPWLDEGLNSYYERTGLGSLLDPTENALLSHLYQERKDQPINTSAERFTKMNYAAIAYLKTAQWMELMERTLGKLKFDQAMQDYFQQWKFKHPAPSDLLSAFQAHSQADLSHYFQLLDKSGPLQPAPARGWKWQLINGWNEQPPYPIKNRITLLPIAGFNKADGWMTGLAVTNLKLPLNDLQWLAIPLYATRSKQLNGIGFINHRWRPNGRFKRIDLGISMARFSFNRFTAPNEQKLTLRYTKLAPGIRFTLRESDARSTQNRFVQFTVFLVGETGYRYQLDTLIQGVDTTFNNDYQTKTDHRQLFQLRYVWENNRALYPFRWEAKMEMNDQFIRPTLTGNYFFNYPKKGGLHVRVFGGAFVYNGSKTLQDRYRQSRYQLQMGAPTGGEDYTYSNYFIGRSAYAGFAAQQIMERDGAFKIRTDRLASPVGRSDDWLFALNLSSSIPDQLNPLQVLPIRIPLQVFADVGTSGATWSTSGETGRWLYVAGLEIPLFYRSIRIFIPLVYSKPYQDYVQSILGPKNRCFQKMSFQIDLKRLTSNRINREIELW